LEAAAWQVLATGEHFEGPVQVTVIVRRGSVEVDVKASAVLRPTGVKGDIDNLVKAVLDALQRGGMLANDSQVTVLQASFGEEQ
jgi:Holliday junction resolvase RusA-like endonuclease